MKNKILTKLLVIAVVFMVTAVIGYGQLNTIGRYKADIPFDFTIGDRDQGAGSFKITVTRVLSGIPVMCIFRLEDPKGDLIQSVVSIGNGHRSKSDQTSLVFNRYGDVYVLAKIVSPDFGYSIRSQRAFSSVKISSSSKKIKPQTVAVSLIKQK